MSTVSSTSSVDNLSSQNTQQKKASSTLDQSSFLKMMTTQLKTQDPFSPVDNTQMVAQMAQFSSVAGISEMNTSLKTIKDDLAASRVGDAAGWIGRSALVPSDTATSLVDGSYAGEITLPAAANTVSYSLVNGSGEIVHTETLGAQPEGTLGFAWDGKAADGTRYAGGPLSIKVSASGSKGTMTASTASWASISGLQSPAGGLATRFVTPLGQFAPGDALKLG